MEPIGTVFEIFNQYQMLLIHGVDLVTKKCWTHSAQAGSLAD